MLQSSGMQDLTYHRLARVRVLQHEVLIGTQDVEDEGEGENGLEEE